MMKSLKKKGLKGGRRDEEERRYEVMSVEKRAGLWLVVRPETEFCHCNLTLCFCNDSPGGTNDFLHWCCYCWSHKFKRKLRRGGHGGPRGGKRRKMVGGGVVDVIVSFIFCMHP